MVALFAQQSNIVEFPQKSNEWYTPSKYIEAAREVMGAIDLDPASCEIANRTVKATRFYTKQDDGLLKPWHGRIWCNPPFGRVHPELKGSTKSWQAYFMHRLLREYETGSVKQAIALAFGTSACMPWFQSFWQYPICIAKSRIEFDKPDGSKDHFGYGNLFIYLGKNEQKFIDIFSQFGTVARRVSTPKVHPVNLELWQ